MQRRHIFDVFLMRIKCVVKNVIIFDLIFDTNKARIEQIQFFVQCSFLSSTYVIYFIYLFIHLFFFFWGGVEIYCRCPTLMYIWSYGIRTIYVVVLQWTIKRAP